MRDLLGTLDNYQVVFLVVVFIIVVIDSGEVFIVVTIKIILDNDVKDGNGDIGAEHVLSHVHVIGLCVDALEIDVEEGLLITLGQRRVLHTQVYVMFDMGMVVLLHEEEIEVLDRVRYFSFSIVLAFSSTVEDAQKATHHGHYPCETTL